MPRVICPNCSNPYTPAAGGAERCPRCGYGARPAPASWTSTAGAPSFTAMQPPAPALAPPGQITSGQERPLNGLALTSMIVGLVGLLPIPLVSWILALLAVIFGVVGILQVRKKGQRGFAMAVTGLVLGCVEILLWIFFIQFVTGLF